MYTIKDFANMIGVTPQTLRNKHRNGKLVPTLVNPDNKYRMYSDEMAYIYDTKREILAYLSETQNTEAINEFKSKLDLLNIKYKIFISDKCSDFKQNEAMKELLKSASKNITYTVLYDKNNIHKEDLELIRFCLNTCFPYIQIKDIADFSIEENIKMEDSE